MKAENGVFITDIRLVKKGEQHFMLATNIHDDRKRNFHFHFTVE